MKGFSILAGIVTVIMTVGVNAGYNILFAATSDSSGNETDGIPAKDQGMNDNTTGSSSAGPDYGLKLDNTTGSSSAGPDYGLKPEN